MRWERQPSSKKSLGDNKGSRRGYRLPCCPGLLFAFSCEKCEWNCYTGESPNSLGMSASLGVTLELILYTLLLVKGKETLARVSQLPDHLSVPIWYKFLFSLYFFFLISYLWGLNAVVPVQTYLRRGTLSV